MRVFRIQEIVRPHGPVSRSKLYADAAAGLITLRKVGGKTVVREQDFQEYLEGKPLIHRARAA